MTILELVFDFNGIINSWFSKAAAILLLLAILDRIDYYFVFKQIKCKVTEENHRIRYTYYRHYKRRKVYKLHQLNGKWIEIDKEHTLITETAFKQKTILHFDFSTEKSKKIDSSIAISQ